MIFFWFIVVFVSVDCLHVPTQSILSSSPLSIFERFGFEKNGTLKVKWEGEYSITASQVGFFLCTRSEYSRLTSMIFRSNSTDLFCRHGNWQSSPEYNSTYQTWAPQIQVCELTMTHFLDPILNNYTVRQSDRFSLILFNCLPCPFSPCPYSRMFELSYTLLNVHYPELSVTDIPFLYFYRFLIIIWILFFLWFLFIILSSYYISYSHENIQSVRDDHEEEIQLRENREERERENENAQRIRNEMIEGSQSFRLLYLLLFITAASKVCVVIFEIFYWNSFSKNGRRDVWSGVASKCAYAASEVILFTSLILLGHGWLIVYEVDSNELQTLSSSFVAVFSALFFFSMYDTITSFVVLYIFLLPNIFTYINQNAEGLEFRCLWLRAVQHQLVRRDQPIWRWVLECVETKLTFFNELRRAVIYYFLLTLVGSLSPLFFPWYCESLPTLIHQTLIILFLIRILYLLRPSTVERGLFTSLSFGDDGNESHSAWVEAARRALLQAESGEHQNLLRDIEKHNEVTKGVVIVQYDTQTKKHKELSCEEKDENPHRNMFLCYPLQQNVINEATDSSESTSGGEDRLVDFLDTFY
jgi:hypothetical protein